MSEIALLFEELAQLGVTLDCDGGRLTVRAAKGVLTPDLQRRLSAGKAEILARLEEAASARRDRLLPRLEPDRAHDFEPFPLSDLQLGFYIANDSYMEYHVRPHFYVELDRRDFDIEAYKAAWNKALRRHRRELCFVNDDIQLQLLPAGDVTITCRVYDLRGLPQDEVQARLLRVRAEMERQELPLDAWPWVDLRVSVWREHGEERSRVHYNHNTYFCDGFGSMQLLAEIDEYYRDPDLSAPPLELSYRDAVLGLERLAASELGAAAREYWFSRLPGLPPPPNIPQKPGVNRRSRSKLERRDGILARALWEGFQQRASAHGVTPSNAIVAAYAYVVATWSNSDHFIFSNMVTRRFSELHPDLPRMIGNFASLYPLEIRWDGDASFVVNAQRIQRQVLEDMKHLQIGGMRVLQELNRLRGSFGTAPSPFVVGSGLSIRNYPKASYSLLETSQTILDHQFFELNDGSYYYMWDLLEELFPAGVIDDMWAAFETMLQRLSREDGAWQETAFDLIGGDDREARTRRNATGAAIPGGSLHGALRVRAVQEGGAQAVLRTTRGILSYRELDAWGDAVAGLLAERGVQPDELVPVVMDRDAEVLAAVMGVLRRGAAYVPIDPRVPTERLALLLREAGARLALTQARYLERLAWPADVTPVGVSMASTRSAAEPVRAQTDLAYVIYTSGSTGLPKGVMIDHRGALNTVVDINQRFAVGPADRVLGVSAFNFDLSVYDIFGTVAAGATLVYPEVEAAYDPTHWLDLMLQEGITIWNSVPALMRLLVDAAERRQVQLPALRLVMLSGDKIPLDLPAAIRRVAPGASLVSLGGATEASIWSIVYPIGAIDPSWVTVPYGYPMVNQTWTVRDRHGRPCPRWVPGELCIGGIGLAQGYWRDAEKTARSFPMDAQTGERIYRTGDLGRYAGDGCLEWMGRVDFQVKIQGHRIELGEIETVLGEHPAVGACVVAAQDVPGTEQRRLVGFVVPVAGGGLDSRQLETFLEGRLPAYMVPTVWRMLDSLPLTANGKVDRKALLALRFEADRGDEAGPREAVAPVTAIERGMLAIWERILGARGIGVTDDFFELGGQSFDAIRIFALIKEELGRSFTLGDMWRARTIRGLAAGGADDRRVVAIDLRGSGAPLFLVHPAGGSVMTYSRLGRQVGRPLYGIQASASPDDASRRRDIVALAAHYVAEVRTVQARGPYVLGGWSSGAMIAFEMAAQIEAAGESVAQVFVLDGPVPVAHDVLGDEQLLLWFLEDLSLGLSLDRLAGESFAGLSPEAQLRKAAALLDTSAGNGVGSVGLEQLASNFIIFRDLIFAGSRYRPGIISADLTVVRVEQDIVSEFSAHPHRHERDWGWGRFTRGEVRCTRVPGTHHTFLREPLVDGWCSLFADVEQTVGQVADSGI